MNDTYFGEAFGVAAANAAVKGAEPDNDALFEGWLGRVLPSPGAKVLSRNAAKIGRTWVAGGSLKLYDLLAPKFTAVAKGDITSTVFTFTDADLGLEDSWHTAAELGFSSLESVDGGTLIDALLAAEGVDTMALWTPFSRIIPMSSTGLTRQWALASNPAARSAGTRRESPASP